MSNIITRVFDYMGVGGWSTQEVEVGGSQPTDAVFVFEQQVVSGELLPLLSVDTDEGIITLDGDQTKYFMHAGVAKIVGSTGNDAVYDQSGAAYDSGTHTTSVTLNPAPTDPTVDGNIQAPVRYEATVELPAESSVEWVAMFLDVPWDSSFVYLWVGDSDDIVDGTSAFIDAAPMDASPTPNLTEWPLNTLSSDPDTLVSTARLSGYTLYPTGTTVTAVVLDLEPADDTGRMTCIVHHHFTDTSSATRTDP